MNALMVLRVALESAARQQAAIEPDDARHDHRRCRRDRNARDRRRRAGARARAAEESRLEFDADLSRARPRRAAFVSARAQRKR